jgi:vacuolar-type H+-ATPase subunit I/STV1
MKEMDVALTKCCERVRELNKLVNSLQKQLKGERELRQKAEDYVKEVEGFLKESINKEIQDDSKG